MTQRFYMVEVDTDTGAIFATEVGPEASTLPVLSATTTAVDNRGPDHVADAAADALRSIMPEQSGEA